VGTGVEYVGAVVEEVLFTGPGVLRDGIVVFAGVE